MVEALLIELLRISALFILLVLPILDICACQYRSILFIRYSILHILHAESEKTKTTNTVKVLMSLSSLHFCFFSFCRFLFFNTFPLSEPGNFRSYSVSDTMVDNSSTEIHTVH